MLKKILPEYLFLIIAILYGFIMIIINPPFQTQDEAPHFIRAYSVSDNIWRPQKNNFGVGSYMPRSIYTLFLQNEDMLFDTSLKTSPQKVINSINIPLNTDDQIYLIHSASMTYSPIPYIPYAFFLKLAKLFETPPFIMLLGCRVISIIIYSVLGFLVIRNIPILKWTSLLLLTYPMHIALCSSIAIDAILIPTGVLFFALVLKFAYSSNIKTLGKKELFILIILSTILGVTKYNFLLTFFIFLIPKEKFGNFYREKLLLYFFTIFWAALLWFSCCRELTFETFEIVDWHEQLKYVLENKFLYIITFFKTIKAKLAFYFISSIGILGNVNIKLPKLIYICYLPFIFLTIYYDAKQKTEFKELNIFKQFLMLIIVGLHTFFVFLIMYITFNPLRNTIIMGVHGRYFAIYLLPIFTLIYHFLYTYTRRHITSCIGEKYIPTIVFLFINISLITSILTLIKRFYL